MTSVVALVTDSRLGGWEFNQDIDDFLVEPYGKQELLSRLRRLLLKANKLGSGATIRMGDLTVADAGYGVRVGGRRIDLTYREYQLLRYLAANPGNAVTRETLLNKVRSRHLLGMYSFHRKEQEGWS